MAKRLYSAIITLSVVLVLGLAACDDTGESGDVISSPMPQATATVSPVTWSISTADALLGRYDDPLEIVGSIDFDRRQVAGFHLEIGVRIEWEGGITYNWGTVGELRADPLPDPNSLLGRLDPADYPPGTYFVRPFFVFMQPEREYSYDASRYLQIRIVDSTPRPRR